MVDREKKTHVCSHFPGVAGAFVRVTMHNFMCHANCVVELGPRINYITGENGSGKSAILTALSVALGAKMKSVGRSSSKSANGMIRSGASAAKISVVISNDGPDAFKPETFGKSIVVEKTLNAMSANSLKLKNERGETVGTKMEELFKLTDHFCLDVDNPITVMTQDMAKKFLHSGDDKKKYQFFLQATLIESLQQRQAIARQNLTEARETLKGHEETMPRLKQEVEELEHELNAFERVQEFRAKVDEFMKRVAWSQVVVMEREIEAEVLAKEECEKRAREAEEKLRAVEEQEREESSKKEDLGKLMEDFEGKLHELTSARHAADAQLREAGRRLQAVETSKLTEDTAVKKLSKKIADLESKIQRTMEAQRGERTETDRLLQELSDKLVESKGEEARCSKEIDEYKNEKEQNTQAQARFARMKKAAEIEINEIRKQIATLKQTSSNRLILYGQNMPKLCDALERRRSEFSKPPIGPIGVHVTLTDQKWIAPVEECLGQAMGAFLVSSAQDMDKLRKLSKECGVNGLSIAMVNFNRGRYEIPPNDVPNRNEFTTMDSVLECKHDAVFNYLVDSAKIERSVLMDDEKSAYDMFHRGAAKEKKVSSVFTQHRKIFASGRTIRNEAFKSDNKVKRLGSDPRSQIAELEKAIEQKQGDARELSNQEAAAMKTGRNISDRVVQKENELRALGQKSRSAAHQLQQAKIDAEGSNDTGVDVSTLQEELDRLNAEASRHQIALREVELEWARLNEAHAVAKSDVDEKVSLADAYKKEVQTHHKSVEVNERTLAKARKAVEHYKKQIEDGKTLHQELIRRIAELTAKRDNAADMVTKNICDREVAEQAGDITIAPDRLQRMYEATKDSMKKEMSRHKRPYEEVNDELSDKRRRLVKLERGTESTRKIVNKLRAGLKKRTEAVATKAAETAKNVSHRFNWHMQRKGHAGQIKVNYVEMKLTIHVTDSDKTKAITDTRIMSGGERSYSTLAFNLALGDESDSPFRAMDEFDVFMDAVNRRISIDTLLEFARIDHFDKQFLFITPQDISAVDAQAEDIKIQRMRAARPA